MICKGLTFLSFLLLIIAGSPIMVAAGDLDDGISKYTDDGIASYDELGKADKNIKFIVMTAKAKAATRQKQNGGDGSDFSTSDGGDANMNSVVMGPGSNVRGDIIIIDQSKGDRTQVAQGN